MAQMLGVGVDGVEIENLKKGVCGAVNPLKDPAPQMDRFNLNSFDSTSNLSVVARSVMNNCYGVISATDIRFTSEASLRS